MSDSDIDDPHETLPDDPQLAFLQLAEGYRKVAESKIGQSEFGHDISEYRLRYINQINAAAWALGIKELLIHEVPSHAGKVWDVYSQLKTDVENLLIQIRIHHSRRKWEFSVALEPQDKQRIHHYIAQIRQAVEDSDCSQDKKDAVFKKLSELSLEIDRGRTRFEILADKVMKIAKLSGDIEREGVRPWGKWVKLILGRVDDAKENEKNRLPAPEERKKLEAPRKKLPKPDSSHDLDDEIPF